MVQYMHRQRGGNYMWIRTLDDNYLVNIETGASIYKQKRGTWYAIRFSKSEFSTAELASYPSEEERNKAFDELASKIENKTEFFQFSEKEGD